ncbi:UNVERIFIED_CONTAM: hypothetical protein FKN15_060928 [Acipenser sinensis]
MDKVDAYMERWHEHQRELKEGVATWYLACLEYGHLPDMCPFEDPLFVQAFNQGEVESAEEWIRLKAIPSPQVDQKTCLKREGVVLCHRQGRAQSTRPTPSMAGGGTAGPKEGKEWWCQEGKEAGSSSSAQKGEPVHPVPMKVEPERQEPKKGKLKSGRWDGYLRLVDASNKGFKVFSKLLNQSYALPNRRTLTRTVLPQLYEKNTC